jgi:hypothetical protein
MPNEERDPRLEQVQLKGRSPVGAQMWAEIGRSHEEAGMRGSVHAAQRQESGFLNIENSSSVYNEHNDILCCLGQQFVDLLQIGEKCEQDGAAQAAEENSLKFERIFNGRRTDLLVAAFMDLLILWRRVFANLTGEESGNEQDSAEAAEERAMNRLADKRIKSRSRRRRIVAFAGGEAVEIDDGFEDDELDPHATASGATEAQTRRVC